MDNELFELCKEVHARTGWKSGQTNRFESYTDVSGHLQVKFVNGRDYMPPSEHVMPLYTSDYLLEKLPGAVYESADDPSTPNRRIQYALRMETPQVNYMSHMWAYFYYDGSEKPEGLRYWSEGNTPLKAILKLVLALDKAGKL